MKIFNVLLLIFVLGFSSSAFAEEKVVTEKVEKKEDDIPKEYTVWLEALKSEMIERGISKETIEVAFARNYYVKSPEVVKHDRKQPEFVFTTTDYLNRVLSAEKVKKAQEKYKNLYPDYKSLEKTYNVPIQYLISFWGLESNFGDKFGKYEIIESLSHLAYDQRRSKFFREELYNALLMMQKYGYKPEEMIGSWAGAMGHFQFMPSTFVAYAVDFDGEGHIDIWAKFDDAIASAANYLTKLGWKQNEPWGMEVSVVYKFDYANSGMDVTKSIADWTKLGVRDVKGNKIKLDEKIQGSIIVPEGRKGKTYLVLTNFKKIMIWNRSENYALAVSKLADYITSGKKFAAEEKVPAIVIKTQDIIKIQKFINKYKIDKVDEDGTLGSKTKKAIKKLQKQAMLPQDGYPDYLLLSKIRKYNPKLGFTVPVQPQKPKMKDLWSKKFDK